MALDYHIIKNTNKETVISVTGANDTLTLSLTGLASSDQVLGATGAAGATGPVVNLSTVITSGAVNSTLSVRRGATGATGSLVFQAAPENAPAIQFNQYGFTENGQNNKDILVTHGGVAGGSVSTWLVLHKQNGFYSKVEYEQYGAYDDETRVGASTTLVGSPDKA
jgi:hypothetical protein